MTTPDYDFLLDCSIDWDPDIDIEIKTTATGVYGAYSGVTGITMKIAALPGSSTVLHANLEKTASERASKPGRIHPISPFNVADLQTHVLPTYENAFVYLNLFKTGDVEGQAFKCLVVKNRLNVP